VLFANILSVNIARADVEILIIRHGEKPEQGLGQLSCKGFNRALALGDVIVKRFAKPDIIIAPNPGRQKKDKGISYSYIRPLATIEPLAITLGLPVEATLDFDNLAGLDKRLEESLTSTTEHHVLVAWEHKVAEQVVRNFLLKHSVNAEVPHWNDDDFDSIYIISQKNHESIKFRVEKQGLNNQSDKCLKEGA
jgi:hypothetical protein